MCLQLLSVWYNRTWMLGGGEGLPRIALSANFRAFLLGYRCRISATFVLLASRCSVCEQDVPTDWAKHVAALGHVLYLFLLRLYLYLLCFVLYVLCSYCFVFVYFYLLDLSVLV